MSAKSKRSNGDLHARRITVSKRVCPDLDDKAPSTGSFDRSQKYLLGGLSPIPGGISVSGQEKRFVSRILEHIRAILNGLVERCINAGVLNVSGDHGLGDQVALEMRVRFSDEEFERREPAGSRRCPQSGVRT